MTSLLLLPLQILSFVLRILPDVLSTAWIIIKWLLGIKPAPIEGVPYVLDGDGLAFDGDIRIRFHGMDAPEMDHPAGAISKAYLAELIAGQHVTVTVKSKDKYGRLVGIVFDEDGNDINARMVADGYARAYASFSSDYTHLEREAKREQRGLWPTGALDLHPELWRKHTR